MRLKAQLDTLPGTPSSSPLNINELPVPTGGWLAELHETWPVKLRVTGPETDVFSGLTRQEANAVFAFATAGQRHAFEALGAAAWQVDFTARENQVVPESLADLLITFTMSGYHHSTLRSAIDAVKAQTTALTSFLSGQQILPDAFYDFRLWAAFDYLHYNPVKRGLVKCVKDWPYSTFHLHVKKGVYLENWAGVPADDDGEDFGE